jgi:hypothetical protein
MLVKGYAVYAALVIAWFTTAAVSGWRMFPPVPPGAASGGGFWTGGGHGTGGYHSTWHGGK